MTEPEVMGAPDVQVEAPSGPSTDSARPEEHFVPAWLAILVLGLLLAVMGVGGYVLRGVMAGEGRQVTVYEADIERWKTEVRANPGNIDYRLQLGYAYQLAGRYDEALKAYAIVLDKEPGNTAALYNRGMSYRALGLDKEAEKELWRVLDEQSDHPLAAKALGEIYAKRGEYKSLLAAVRPVVELHPQMADLQYLTGIAYENTGHPDWAVARYRLALKYSPDMVAARDALERLGETP